MNVHNGRPGDERHFVHKRLVGAVTGFISGGPLGAAAGFVGAGGNGRRTRALPFPVQTFAPRPTAGCPPGFIRDTRGECVELRGRKKGGISGAAQRFIPGGETGFEEFGEAVMGQFGAALQPAQVESSRLVCPRGTVLGMDGLCYNRRDLRNNERKWPRGTRPLLTGGDMRCIRIASRAATKLAKKQKQLRQMGMLPPLPKARKQKALPSGHHAHVQHD